MPRVDDSTDIIPPIPTLRFASVELEVTAGPDASLRYRLNPGTTRLGTAASCQLPLHDPAVSRLHCEIRVEADQVRVVDSGSTNGTFIDGLRIAEAWLARGTTIRLGNTTLRVDIGDQPLMVTLAPLDHFGGVIGSSAEMRRVYAMLERIGPTDATVLIQGETGTGKEVVARAIHGASKRASGPFVAVDCGAIPENLIESELFGHVRGAFSGAVSDRIGLFEEASGGTIFLDEIGELPVALQPKLLRVLETRATRRVGNNAWRQLDVRVLAATNRSLASSVNDSTFREDLYYRLAVLEIFLPPLRARREDIPVLANHFYRDVTGTNESLPPELLATMTSRSWPGNVRELRNFVQRAAFLGWSSAHSAALPEVPPVPAVDGLIASHLPLREARAVWTAQFESLYVAAVLRRSGGNVTRAAEIAGVNRRYLHRLIAEHGIRGAGEVDEGVDPPGDDEVGS